MARFFSCLLVLGCGYLAAADKPDDEVLAAWVKALHSDDKQVAKKASDELRKHGARAWRLVRKLIHHNNQTVNTRARILADQIATPLDPKTRQLVDQLCRSKSLAERERAFDELLAQGEETWWVLRRLLSCRGAKIKLIVEGEAKTARPGDTLTGQAKLINAGTHTLWLPVDQEFLRIAYPAATSLGKPRSKAPALGVAANKKKPKNILAAGYINPIRFYRAIQPGETIETQALKRTLDHIGLYEIKIESRLRPFSKSITPRIPETQNALRFNIGQGLTVKDFDLQTEYLRALCLPQHSAFPNNQQLAMDLAPSKVNPLIANQAIWLELTLTGKKEGRLGLEKNILDYAWLAAWDQTGRPLAHGSISQFLSCIQPTAPDQLDPRILWAGQRHRYILELPAPQAPGNITVLSVYETGLDEDGKPKPDFTGLPKGVSTLHSAKVYAELKNIIIKDQPKVSTK